MDGADFDARSRRDKANGGPRGRARQTDELRVHIQDIRFNLGEEASCRFLRIIAGKYHATIDTKQSRRLEFAHWIESTDNPLTAPCDGQPDLTESVFQNLFLLAKP